MHDLIKKGVYDEKGKFTSYKALMKKAEASKAEASKAEASNASPVKMQEEGLKQEPKPITYHDGSDGIKAHKDENQNNG